MSSMLVIQIQFVTFVSILCLVNSARILGISHIPAYSHFTIGDCIYKELAARGHEVTLITPYEIKDPGKNFRHVVLTGMIQKMEVICSVKSAKILGISHIPAYSHYQLGDTIYKELAARGHQVTVINPHNLKTPVKNLKHVVLTGMVDKMEDLKQNLFNEVNRGIIWKVFWLDLWGIYFAESVLNHTNVQNLLNSNETFDLVIQENFLNEAFYGFSNYYKVPRVVISTIGATRWSNPKMGNPSNPAYVPDLLLSYSSNMNFFERAFNTIVYAGTSLWNHVFTYPMHNRLLQKYFPGSPHLYDLMYNTSLMLFNSHTSTNHPIPLLPNMIEIGGYHVRQPKPLPKELQHYLDNAKDGVIYFSMGSTLKTTDIPEEARDNILKALGKLKQKILWKWEEDVLPRQPSNVKLGKWFPQQDILAHPNIKLFITHGGLLSTIEAIYHGVPVLGIPVFGDQELNVANAVHAGYGLGLPYKELNEVTFGKALDEVLNNPKYTEIAKQRCKIMHDQTMKPLDRAIYWIEYVIRHQGAPHLKTAALNLQWYQYLLLDVAAMLTVGLILLIWLVCKIVKQLRRYCHRNGVNVQKKLN